MPDFDERPTPLVPTSRWRRWVGRALFIVSVGIIACAGVILFVQYRYASRIHYATYGLAHAPVAIVLGASVKNDGTPSDALRDRVDTGADLFHQGVVDSILMTGDDGQFAVNEIKAMVTAAREDGIPEQAIQTDGHGYRTYESCKRAHDFFGVTQAIVVTQRFHLGRALYLCNSLGIDSTGYVADRQPYVRIIWFWIRDFISSVKAFSDIVIVKPKPPVAYSE
jgi:vancomycin permeability regulator SanA